MNLMPNTQFDLKRNETSFIQRVNKLQEKFQIGLLDRLHQFAPSPISLTPWQLFEADFKRALLTAKALSQLSYSAIKNPAFLLSSLQDFNDHTNLLYQFKRILERRIKNNIAIGAKAVNINRFDLLLDKNNHWKLVESNAIAAGMGPFSEQLSSIHQHLSNDYLRNAAPNSSIKHQSNELFLQAKKIARHKAPNIVFVVEPEENNVYDQQYLAKALENLGATVIFRTFNQLNNDLSSKSKSLYLNNYGKISLFYYRSGYNLVDYKDQTNESSLLHLREWVEKHQVAVCPSIEQQVASSKWLQMKLSLIDEEHLHKDFNMTLSDAKLVTQSLGSDYQKVEDIHQVQHLLHNQNWLLKNQNEGGGNVLSKSDSLPGISLLKRSYFLMKKIDSTERNDVLILNNNRQQLLKKVISELGVFIVGDKHDYGGYLLRSKSTDKLETGVHSGNGFLDCVRF